MAITMDLPKRNSEALIFFAAGVKTRKPQPWITVNSMVLEGDTIYHHGHHYPMAKIARRANGSVKAVYVNSTRWDGPKGFGPGTNQYVSELHQYIKQDAPAGVPVYRIPLSGDTILVQADPRNPEPIIPDLDIPVCPRQAPRDPGPKPVLDTDHPDCIAGTREDYSYQRDWMTYGRPIQPGAFVVKIGNYRYERQARNGTLVYGSEGWALSHETGTTYKQCPHCRAHQMSVYRWYEAMTGRGNQCGWTRWTENIERFGDAESWREARRELMAERKVQKAAFEKWAARNTVNHHSIPTVKMGNVRIPKINPETGRITRTTFATMKLKREREARYAEAERQRLERWEQMEYERERRDTV